MSTGEYDDIIDLPHHVSAVHPRMSLHDRAAQFAPFSALTGYEEALEETARITEPRKELSPSEQVELNRRLNFLKRSEALHPEVTVRWFQPDERKQGGRYAEVTGRVKRFAEAGNLLILDEGTEVPVRDISELGGSVFEQPDPGLFL